MGANKHLTLVQLLLLLTTSHVLICRTTGGQPLPSLGSPCPHAININTNNQFGGTLHFICLQPTRPQPTLDVVRYTSRTLVGSVPVTDLNTTTTNHMVSFVDDEGTLRVLVADSSRFNGTSMYSTNGEDGNFTEELQTINTQFVTTMTIWRLELSLEWHLAIAQQPAYKLTSLAHPAPVKPSIISIFSWRSSYFDKYQIIELPNVGHVNKIEPFQINGQSFLIVALEGYHSNRITSDEPVASLIYKLHFGDGSLNWSLYQRLETRLTVDARAFTISHGLSLRKDYYFALLGEMAHNQASKFSHEGSYGLSIYKYFGDEFKMVLFLDVAGVTKLDALSYGTGDSYVIIGLLSELSHQVSLYSFDGQQMREMSSPGLNHANSMYHNANHKRSELPNFHLFMAPPMLSANETGTVEKRTSPDMEQSLSLPAFTFSTMGADNVTHENVYIIPTSDTLENSNVTKRNQIPEMNLNNLTSWCQTTLSSLISDNFYDTIKMLQPRLGVRPNHPIQLFGNLILEDGLQVSNLLHAPIISDLNNITAPTPMMNFSSTFSDMVWVHQEIDRVKYRVDHILVDDGTEQIVERPLAFQNLTIPCMKTMNINPASQTKHRLTISCPYINNIHTTLFNHHNVTGIEKQAFLNSSSATIFEDVRFDHLVLRGEVEILSGLNGIDIEDIVFKRGPISNVTVQGPKMFAQGLFSSSDLIVDRWLGRPVDEYNYLVSRGDQRIESPLLISKIILASAGSRKRINQLNGLNLDLHLDQVSLADGDNTFNQPIEIDQLFLNGPIHFRTPHSHLNGINIEDLWLNTLFKHSDQNVSAHLNFAGHVHVSFAGDIQVYGPINGLYLNASNVLMANRDYNFTQPVIFHHDLNVNHLHLEMDLNGIQVLHNERTGHKELSILYNDRPQILSSIKILDKVHIAGRSYINGHINGHVNLTHLFQTVVEHNNGYRFSQVNLQGYIRQPNNVPVTFNFVNDIEHITLCDLANKVLQRSPELRFRGMQFRRAVQFSKLRCGAINGFPDLTNVFLTKFGNQQVAGTLRFVNGVTFNTSVNIVNSLNGLNIGGLSYAVSKALNETRTGHREVKGDFVIDDLIVNRINDLELSNVFFTKSDAPQLIRAPVFFERLSIENILNIRGNINTRFFNQLNVSNILLNTLHYDQPQIIYNHFELSTLQILPGSNLATNLLNNFNLRRLYEDSVLIDVPQQIVAPKIFRGQVDLNRVLTAHGIDQLTNHQLNFNMLLFSDELIQDLEFEVNVIIKKELEIFSGLINGIRIDLFARQPINNDTRYPIITTIFRPIRLNELVRGRGLDEIPPYILINSPQTPTPGYMMPPFYYPNMIPKNTSNRPTFEFLWRPTAQVLTPFNFTSSPMPHQPWDLMRPTIYPMQPPFFQETYPAAPPPPQPLVYPVKPVDTNLSLLKPQYPVKWIDPIEMMSPVEMMQLKAITELGKRINKYLSVAFYYEITQKQPAFGPVLHAADNPIQNEQGRSLLLLKSTSKTGEPCLNWGQTIAVMTQLIRKSSISGFTQSSRIQETNNPTIVSSLVVDKSHFLFVLDTAMDSSMYSSTSQVLVYSWDYSLGMYNLSERVVVDGFPTALKSFVFRNRACFIVADPKVLQGNHSGAPVLHCQRNPLSGFELRTVILLDDVHDFDVITTSSEILIATLSQRRNIEQIGELGVYSLDRDTGSVVGLLFRRTIRPLKLHLFRGPQLSTINLVVSEALTSSNDERATTRIFAYHQGARKPYRNTSNSYAANVVVVPNGASFREIQVIQDDEFYDIQTVKLDHESSLIMFQSVHSIAIYAPFKGEHPSCELEYVLVQRLPTRGANKFLAFNELSAVANGTGSPLSHFLILSKDNCDQQKYSTLVLKAKFK